MSTTTKAAGRPRSWRWGALALAAALAGSGATAVPAAADPKRDHDRYCGSNAMVEEKLPNGSRWQLCWHVDVKTGLVLEKVAFKGKRDKNLLNVLDSITMAQLNVPYDSGYNEWNDITSYGFGGDYMQEMAAADCEGRRRSAWTGAGEESKRVLCVSKLESGLAYRLEGASPSKPYSVEGHDLVLKTISKVGWYEYLTEYVLADDGQISVRLGATGDLAPRDFTTPDEGWPIGPGQTDYSVNHYHSAFWKVNFGIGATEKVEQYDTTPTGQQGRRGAILKTAKKDITTEDNLNTATRRWWRVVAPGSLNADKHPRSYELALGKSDPYEEHPETMPDVSFTQYKPCEKFATFNQDPECPGTSILDYTDGQTMTDPVAWVRIGFHHVPRDEDQSPMPVHWQGFDLIPRDFSAQNPLIPDGRLSVNGDGVA